MKIHFQATFIPQEQVTWPLFKENTSYTAGEGKGVPTVMRGAVSLGQKRLRYMYVYLAIMIVRSLIRTSL